jgi:hypothetical protein
VAKLGSNTTAALSGFGFARTFGKSPVNCTEAEELQPPRMDKTNSAANDFIVIVSISY